MIFLLLVPFSRQGEFLSGSEWCWGSPCSGDGTICIPGLPCHPPVISLPHRLVHPHIVFLPSQF